MASRLYEAGIWENDDVRSEVWFDPKKGGIALLVDVMVAEGRLTRMWSEEDRQFVYRTIDSSVIARLTI